MKGKKIVVTGGAGFLGHHLVRALLDRGADVHVIDIFVGGKKKERIHSRAKYHKVDITRLAPLMRVMKGAQYVFHLAALPRVQFSIDYPERATKANINGTTNVLIAAHATRVRRVIYSASSSAYGDQPILPQHENMPVGPKSPYALQKYVGELSCRVWHEVYGLETVSLRYFNIYGSNYDPNGPYAQALGKFLFQRSHGKPMTIFGDGSQTRDLVHVSDVVRANILGATSKKVGKGEIINIGSGKNISIKRLTELIGGPVVYLPRRLEPHDTQADNTLAHHLLGWEPRIRLEDGIEELKMLARS